MKYMLVVVWFTLPRGLDLPTQPNQGMEWGQINQTVSINVISVHDDIDECRDAMQFVIVSPGIAGCMERPLTMDELRLSAEQ